ncbi:Methyltransferase domain-containing protein [Actinopolyspora lacussalsi subsp. righensis]|uniref:Methyltransferase domain-containing protein n=1 Tax=Actinopolyspora righensis TaxID=995060 RepID=A0A1I6XB08_9ACTN|nr:methyltransferase domain-containing protein [Actinopolyspora righensis]SFT35142.1 Methyltransferase domain-containing protein [Actinopolyspora righensis]
MSASDEVYSQGHAESVVRSQHWRRVDNSAAYLVERLQPGQTVLDVGCGPGTITVDLAGRVAPGRVVGVDPGEPVLAQARKTATTERVDNVEFRRGDVHELDFDDDTFDVVHAHQVLLHLTDPVGGLREMLRVARPDGVIAIRDTDYAGAFWWPADDRLERWREVYRSVARANGTEPDAGRRLLAWARAAGAVEVTPNASIWCHATPEERAWWGDMWADRMLGSRITEQAVAGGHATYEELATISAAWSEWARHPDGWFAIPHGEVLCRAPG